MSRYIDVDALYETLCRLWDKSDSEDFEKGVFEIVINAPSIDIEPKKGEWIDRLNYRDGSRYNVCSECGYFDDERDDLTAYNFCPDCGADMRKREDE